MEFDTENGVFLTVGLSNVRVELFVNAGKFLSLVTYT